MEKYGVQYDDEKSKTASTEGRCPECGMPLDPKTPRYCKDCGTKPFERRQADKK